MIVGRVVEVPVVPGLANTGRVFWNIGTAKLVEAAIWRGEGRLSSSGALAVLTGKYTGRSPEDKFIVDDAESRSKVAWGHVNKGFTEDQFSRLYSRMLAYLQSRDLFVFDGYVGADPARRLSVRVVNEFAWHNLFARQLFLRPAPGELADDAAECTVVCAPGFKADPEIDGTRSEAFVVLNLTKRMILIGGTHYAGEMKKSVFTMMNYLLPAAGVLPMHCAANIGPTGNTALFFGLSGTGKTTLSADPARQLIGDDEHGWSQLGVFNFEGGCYAKCIGLTRENEPQIWEAIRFGSIMENVVVDDDTAEPDYSSDAITENTRAAYPVDFIPNAVIPGVGGHPTALIFLTADATGVMPPISRLEPDQAMYHFLSGYTSKLAGTERGILTPQSTFSSCFGEPFLPLPPAEYAEMLRSRIKQHGSRVYLINTGWIGGPYGVGSRIKLRYTRAMVQAAVEGLLDDDVEYRLHPVFNVLVPTTCPSVPAEILDARSQWADPDAYDAAARKLAAEFQANFSRFTSVDETIKAAGPRP